MNFCQHDKLIVFTDQFQVAHVETVRKAGSKTTYWLKTKSNSFPIETLDGKTFLYHSDYGKKPCFVIPPSTLLIVLILLVFLFSVGINM